eukprot:6083494-Prymnesium_polylepis.1
MVALGVDHDVAAGLHARQVLEGVVSVPRAPTVNDHLEPTGDWARGAPRRSLRDVACLELGGSKA